MASGPTRRPRTRGVATFGSGLGAVRPRSKQLERLEIDVLLEAIHRHYGYDFRNYAQASLRRRILQCVQAENLTRVSELIPRVLHDPGFFSLFLQHMSVGVTSMFRDPAVYRAIRRVVIPFLKTFPFVKIWHAGCSSGEEVYSMAILLQEEGFLDRCQLYATDFNRAALQVADDGIYDLAQLREWTEAYRDAGGKGTLTDYFSVSYNSAKVHSDLRANVTFAHHNLAADHTFGEMHVVMCRNVLIYFDRALQERVVSLFRDSLVPGGYLCLGSKESIQGMDSGFDLVAPSEKIFRATMKPGEYGGQPKGV